MLKKYGSIQVQFDQNEQAGMLALLWGTQTHTGTTPQSKSSFQLDCKRDENDTATENALQSKPTQKEQEQNNVCRIPMLGAFLGPLVQGLELPACTPPSLRFQLSRLATLN